MKQRPLRIVHLSTSDLSGGAARAAHSLHRGLQALQHESHMRVLDRRSSDDSIAAFRPPLDFKSRIVRRFRRERIERDFARYRRSRPPHLIGDSFNDDRSCHAGRDLADQLPPCDLVNLHIVVNFVDYRGFFAALPPQLPVVWTLHDMHVFTGGCHYDYGCARFVEACGACPQLGSANERDLSRAIWRRKRDALAARSAATLQVATNSHWLAHESRRSSLLGRFTTRVIPYGLNADVFSPRDKAAARALLGIPADACVLLFVADSLLTRRKGFVQLLEAVNGMAGVPGLFLLSVGDNEPPIDADIARLHRPFVNDDDLLAQIYSAADVFVMPSLQEAFGLTALEAMACGTPVAAFATGGIVDMVRPGVTGELAPTGDVAALRAAIVKLLDSDAATVASLANAGRRMAVDEFSPRRQAEGYVELYRSMLKAPE